MVPIVETVEIARSPADVFAYLDDLSRHGEWQQQIVSVHVDTPGPTGVGSRATEQRRVPGGVRTFTYQITEYDSPRRVSFAGVDGPVRPVGTVTVEPVGDGSRSRLTLQFDLKGHGFGKLLAPLARRSARKQIPKDQVRLKQILERPAPSP